MLEKLITFALQQRGFVLIATAVIVIAGWNAVQNLPIEAFPDVEDVHVQVVTQVPGQGPEEVERTVTLPIELEMSGVPHLKQLRSVSITGLSVITLTFSERTDDYFGWILPFGHLHHTFYHIIALIERNNAGTGTISYRHFAQVTNQNGLAIWRTDHYVRNIVQCFK